MPKVSRNKSVPSRSRRRPATIVDEATGEEIRVSSVLFGLVMLIAIVVATAAWMGGSLSQIETRFGGFMDDTARMAGVSVNDVSVLGLEQNPALAEDVRAAAMIEPGENMFRADPKLIRRRVEATRKVLNVRVHRLWPGQIVIIADAAEPVALWHDGKEWTVVDGLGRILPDARADDHKTLVRLAGTGAPKAAPALVKALANTPDVASRMAVATRVADRRWDIRLISGATVRLPEDDALETSLTRLATLQTRTALMQRPLKMIDLRNKGRVYLSPSTGARKIAEAARS
ncbi:cell division protein FtsQ/DivIB [Hyphomonas johnsonii]|jgi:cell division protein FtsQ|uniref:Putative cell division protein FtsQ n=1 Tax=Hyphomonas johnsonii MHS-2 TaxID=1280950 RepID=A0A059FJE6_9PROT|nr:cell division protein FtsQ/DivIB [Hyphomonas johnsonii]KCZ90651.1 putative cell division protein FtsQ [Hyphomonas johnsonii MHS-2]